MTIGIILFEYGITKIRNTDLYFREFEFFIKRKTEFFISAFIKKSEFSILQSKISLSICHQVNL